MTNFYAGILLPSSLLNTQFFAILSAFVAVNTLIYVTLAIAKILPRVYLSDIFPQRGRRREPRGINPNASAEDNAA